MESWYLLEPSSTTPAGPFTLERMRSMAAGGSLRRDSQVARAGAAGWSTADTDPLLAPLFGIAATPPTSPQPMPGPGGEPYTFGNAWRLGERTVKARYKTMLVVGLVLFAFNLPSFAVQFLTNPVFRGPDYVPSPGSMLGTTCFTWIFNILVGFPLIFGATFAGAEASQGRGSLSDLFAPFRRYGAALGATLLLGAVIVGVSIVAYIPLIVAIGVGASAGGTAALGTAALAGGLVTITLALVLTGTVVMRVWLAPVAAIDPAMGSLGIADSFRFSWAATRGRGWSMMGFTMVSGILAGLTVLACGIGYVLLGLPILYSMLGAMYQLVIRNAPRA